MFFFNGRVRNAHVAPMLVRDRSYKHKVGHSSIMAGCLSIIAGLIFIVIGVISETKKTTFIGVGIISLGVGIFMTTVVCFYAEITIWYRNWAYGPHIVPNETDTTHVATMNSIAVSTVQHRLHS